MSEIDLLLKVGESWQELSSSSTQRKLKILTFSTHNALFEETQQNIENNLKIR